MVLGALLAIHVLGLGGPGKVHMRHYQVHGWHVRVYNDSFTGAVSCSIQNERVRLLRQTLIFHLGGGDGVTNAYFRIDGGPARSVHEAFAEDQTHGFFPERGWIDNPDGGDVALPLSYVTGAHQIYIRAKAGGRTHRFDLRHLPDALAKAQASGCGAI